MDELKGTAAAEVAEATRGVFTIGVESLAGGARGGCGGLHVHASFLDGISAQCGRMRASRLHPSIHLSTSQARVGCPRAAAALFVCVSEWVWYSFG